MCNIEISLEESGTIYELSAQLEKILLTQPKALTLLISAGNQFSKDSFDPLLTTLDIPVSGGIFHKIIFKDKLLEQGSIIIAWYNDISITNYKNIENIDSIKNLAGITTSTTSHNKSQGEYLVFIDGSVPTLEENLDALYTQKGFLSSFVGGGAGSLTGDPIPCIISNEGLLKNTMQTVDTDHNSHITVTHGWKKKSGPHLVTSVDRSKLKSLNYKPIIDVYKRHHKQFGADAHENNHPSSNFNRYPIGIENIDGDLLIRDPILQSDDEIEYIGNIPEYSKVHILEGTTNSIRDEVDNELNELKLKDKKNIDVSFIFSCANRDDTDGAADKSNDSNHHSKEVKMLSQHLKESKYIVGALSVGEIATSKSRLLQLHSKTIVLAQLEASS